MPEVSADYQRIHVGELDITVASRFVSFDASPWTSGTFEYVPRYGASIGSWVCKIQRSIGGSPQDFPTAISFSSANVIRPATDAADLSGTSRVDFTTTTAGSSGIVDIWAIVKAVQ